MLDTTTARGLLMLTLRLMLDTFMVSMDTHTDMPVDTTMESNPLMDIIINLKFFKN